MKKPSAIQAAKKARRALNGELIEARETNRGTGLFARVDFRPGEVVCGLVGNEEVIRVTLDERLLRERPEINEYGSDAPNGGALVPRDPRALGWHLANHSCNPNSKLETEFRVGLRAVRPIAAGEEITCWYGWSRRQVQCRCGERNCTGWIGVPIRQRPDGWGPRREDLAAVIASAWPVRNIQALHTVLNVLGREGVSDDGLRAFLRDVLGSIEGDKAIAATGGS